MRLTPMFELYSSVCGNVSTWYPPRCQLWSRILAPYMSQMPLPVSTLYVVSTTPSSNATMSDAVLNTEPGSNRSDTALFFIS